jgi:hypothetical protein
LVAAVLIRSVQYHHEKFVECFSTSFRIWECVSSHIKELCLRTHLATHSHVFGTDVSYKAHRAKQAEAKRALAGQGEGKKVQ